MSGPSNKKPPPTPREQDRLNHHNLKTRQRETRDKFPEALSLRVHRALSWLNRAEQETEDIDAKFIFLWVAFNAAYANSTVCTHYGISCYTVAPPGTAASIAARFPRGTKSWGRWYP